jgi:hypothetical protein
LGIRHHPPRDPVQNEIGLLHLQKPPKRLNAWPFRHRPKGSAL